MRASESVPSILESEATGKVAEILLNASFEQGEPFCENMLDLDAGA